MAFSNTAQSCAPNNLATTIAGLSPRRRNRIAVPFMRSLCSLVALSLLCGSLLACAAQPQSHPNPGPDAGRMMPLIPNPHVPKTPPDGAASMGMKSTITPPKGSAPPLDVPGAEAEVFSFTTTEFNDHGESSDCFGAYADGSFALACYPLVDTCSDGSPVQAALLYTFDASTNATAFAFIGSNLCGLGYDILACTLDSSGNESCGPGDITDGKIVLKP